MHQTSASVRLYAGLLLGLCTTALFDLAAAVPPPVHDKCRYLPSDARWPAAPEWAALNRTVGGRLIRGVPFGQPCYGSGADEATCKDRQANWNSIEPFLEDPVNVISAYFQNTTCSPFFGPFSSDLTARDATCSLGGLATYAIDVADASSVVAGVNFARKNNIRLIVKNTGHDLLGRSTGQGSLALWTHHLKEKSFVQYKSKEYTGPAARIGAGVQVKEMYEAASARGLRVTGGGCPTVGAAGGWVQSGGHGPLSGAYGLGSDQTLEFDVVTAAGKRLTASRTQNPDLFWALSGGGPSNYAVVLSVTMKAHRDGPVAGAKLAFVEPDTKKFFAAVEAWERHLLRLDAVPGIQTSVTLMRGVFSLDYATLPDARVKEVQNALAPFLLELKRLGIQATSDMRDHENFARHYGYFETASYSRNVTVGNRLIPRGLVRDGRRLSQLTQVYQKMLEVPNSVAFLLQANVTHAVARNSPKDTSVLPAWRDSLFLLNFGILSDPLAPWSELQSDLAVANRWQQDLRDITPGGGSYMNEATYNFPHWKKDYYGEHYDRLARVKAQYDPGFVFWSQPAAGNEAYSLQADGRLCKA